MSIRLITNYDIEVIIKMEGDRLTCFKIATIIRMFCCMLLLCVLVSVIKTISYAKEKAEQGEVSAPGNLYAQSAVLMDGSSGRILYEKNGTKFMANASTTKILTCILALEKGELTDVVEVSSYAASMPDVQLHIKEGEQYYLGDLLYSLMLESHNDVAVAIAEHISGSQEEFSKLMNRKAKEIGCKNTVFLTPNGLDATQQISGGEIDHGTTAEDLALIMRYCINISPQKEQFLKITGTESHAFQNIEGSRNFFCRNHNAFLNMMEGALSGKTGFTNKAGYCYVGALEEEGRCYIVALLACGWPGNKNYKWSDCRKLMEYGVKNYERYLLETLEMEYRKELVVEVKDAKRRKIGDVKTTNLKRKEGIIKEVLLKDGENIDVKVKKEEIIAPVKRGEIVGELEYIIQGKTWNVEEIYCDENIEKIDFQWCWENIIKKMMLL